MGDEPTYGLDRLTLEQLCEKAQELRGARGGADAFARFFGPSDFVEMVAEHERRMAERLAALEAVAEAARRIGDLRDHYDLGVALDALDALTTDEK